MARHGGCFFGMGRDGVDQLLGMGMLWLGPDFVFRFLARSASAPRHSLRVFLVFSFIQNIYELFHSGVPVYIQMHLSF